MNKELKTYYNAIENLTKVFCKRYFKNVYKYKAEDWVGTDIGGVICINDFWFNADEIVVAIKHKATKKELFSYYDYSYEKRLNSEDCVSFTNYLKYFRGLSFIEIDNICKTKLYE
jgi:hypothetical protein